MSGISTHVLNTTSGAAAAGVAVILEHEATAGRWRVLANTKTDEDGRVKNLLAPGFKLTKGLYRLRFETGAYWRNAGVECFHPRVEVVFEIADAVRHHHVPLLVSPFGFTTYRGT